MSLKSLDELFSDNAWSGLHDVIVDTLDVQPTVEQAKAIFKKLPDDVQAIGLAYGLNDTGFRDDAYICIQKLRITLE